MFHIHTCTYVDAYIHARGSYVKIVTMFSISDVGLWMGFPCTYLYFQIISSKYILDPQALILGHIHQKINLNSHRSCM